MVPFLQTLLRANSSDIEKGAFTGAHTDKPGLFQAATGGTLFLDEVADLPMQTQVKLLRAIQEKAVRPLGAEAEIATDVRLLSATHKNLGTEAREGRFRDDLYYRINVIGLHVPPLRDRKADIPELAEQLLDKIAGESGSLVRHIATDAMDALLAHDFPGNVRELENILSRALALSESNTIHANDLLFEPKNTATEHLRALKSTQNADQSDGAAPNDQLLLNDVGGDLDHYMAEVESRILNAALLKYRWNKTATAKALGVSFRSLRYRLKKLGLDE